jgi:cellulose synthase/poly-beta-1,6-N-acetylglucosamine synthase-like glycosyltransferase
MISVVIISKDESALDETIIDVAGQLAGLAEPGEIVVVDASSGRLDHIRRAHEPAARWLDFDRPAGARVTIPHQRNAGVRAARGDIIVFTDAGCRPFPSWLDRLVAPLRAGESVTAGHSQDLDGAIQYELPPEHAGEASYLAASPTLNFAFRREVFDAVGGFDESFQYGSDVDFSWRLIDLGYRIRWVPDAILAADYGTSRRRRRRAYVYGKARVRLYRKHRSRRRDVLRNDPLMVVYPLFLIGLPVTLVFLFLGLPLLLIFPLYLLLLIIPAWRNRSHGIIRVLTDHLWFGAGVLAELTGR